MVNGLPLITIIVPTRNEERNIGRCLSSVLSQNYPRKLLEIILIDNHSEDRTVELAQNYGAKVYIKGPERNVQRDYGVQQSNGKYLMFIDADMELENSIVKDAVEKCESNGYEAVILPEVSEGEGFWANCRKLEKKSFLNDNMMETPNRFIKREVYVSVGGYDKTLIVGEDFDLGDRIKEAGYKVGRVKSFIRHHETRTFWEMIKKHYYYGKEMKKYLRKSKGKGLRRFFIIRTAYVKSFKIFIKEPVHCLGLIVMKLTQYFAAGLGFGKAIIGGII